jgi:hypothetical protein
MAKAFLILLLLPSISAIEIVAQSLTDDNSFKCGDVIVDNDWNEYTTVRIGYQCWTQQNLKTIRFSNGEIITFLQRDDN